MQEGHQTAREDLILEISHVTKIFPGVRALDDVGFTLRRGEIHALIGENGAGKSTFIKVLTGVHQPDSGTILLNGQQVRMTDPLVARRLGIAAIYQHLAAYPHLSVAENIFMGNEQLRPPGFISWRNTRRRAARLLQSLGSSIDPAAQMGELSVAQQQIVEIAKALSQDASVLIMDEPTAALSLTESEELYSIVRGLKAKGTSVILISHRFEDIFSLADRVTVLRDARYIGTWDIDEADSALLVNHMVGRSIDRFFPQKTADIGEELLKVSGLGRTGFFQDVSFSLHAGEILGLTGLVGAGRTEVVEAITGVTRPDYGTITLMGQQVRFTRPGEALGRGLALMPEDRQKQGLLLPWSIRDNVSLPMLDSCRKHRLLSQAHINRMGSHAIEQLAIKARSGLDTADSLSGGNQQKVVLGKLLSSSARVMVMDEPTKGVDVGSKAAIYQIMCDLAAQGFGILMVSSEMPEVMAMCDRAVIMRQGRVSTILDRADFTPEGILRASMPLERKEETPA
ncbi:MAG: sugar ABC transporter ATP-binding protein [Clostridiales bacterium]|nr:sugar ABC transporter ATP-binding protein [Clostridiales bacterium]